MKKNGRIAPEEFITAWQESSTTAEFLKRSGMKRTAAVVRASFYRKRGIPLQRFKSLGRRPLDVAALRELALAKAPKENKT